MITYTVRSRNRSFNAVFEGDSLTQGTIGQPWPTRCMANFAYVNKTFTNVAIGGSNLAAIASRAAAADALYDPSKRVNFMVLWAGTNDVQFTAGATWLPNLWSYCDARRLRGWKLGIATMPAKGAGVNLTYWNEYNDGIRANWPAHADALLDLALDVRFQNASDTTYYNVDTVHLSDTGYTVAAQLAYPVCKTLARVS